VQGADKVLKNKIGLQSVDRNSGKSVD